MEETVKALIPIVCECFENKEINSANVHQCVNNSKVSDHHAIIPTKEIHKINFRELPSTEYNILLLVATKLLTATSSPYIYETVKVTVNCQNNEFFANGKKVIDNGFKTIEKLLRQKVGKNKTVTEDEEQTFNNIDVKIVDNVVAKKSSHFTAPPKQYTEDTLLSAMETAGNNEYEDDTTDKKGLGTPATRAGIIETLVKHKFICREGKKIIPTETGINLIKALPEEVKSPKMTAEWETALQKIEKGEESSELFLQGIENFIKNIIKEYSSVDTSISYSTQNIIGICPKCRKKVIEYKKSYSCESGKDGCGFVIWKTVSGKEITSAQAKKILEKGRSDLIKGFISNKSGKVFDAYLKLSTESKIEFEFPKNNFKT